MEENERGETGLSCLPVEEVKAVDIDVVVSRHGLGILLRLEKSGLARFRTRPGELS
jgi:hypothetical protein